MTINKTVDGTTATISVEGRLDTMTSPQLEAEITKLEGIEKLLIDFAKLEYISSAGLRVLLSAFKTYSKKGGMIIRNANETVLDIFEVTGFKDILTIE